MKVSEEDRLVLRITHLRALRDHAADAQIVVELNDFIAATETELVSLTPNRQRKPTLH